MSKKRYHNKKRNTALLYEFLVRHVSNCLLEQNKEEANRTVLLMKKYFSKGTPLHEELSLFNAVLTTSVKSQESAHRLLESVKTQFCKLNVRAIDNQKSQLIKEINYSLNKGGEFYNHKVPNYSTYASIHTVLNENAKKRSTLDEVNKIKLEDVIYEHLTKEKIKERKKIKVNPNYSNTVYKFLIEKFNNKYKDKLTESQKRLLTQYVVSLVSENRVPLKEYVDKEVRRIKTRLKSVRDPHIKGDSDIMVKLNECYKKFVTYNLEDLTEENIVKVMEYLRLVEEVESE